jgi:hypothetical protein
MQGAAGDWLSGGSFELAPAAAAGTPASSPRLPAAGGERGGRGWVGLGILWGWSRPARCGFDFLLTRAAAAAARRHHGGASRRVVLPSPLPTPRQKGAQRKREGNETNRWGAVVSRGTRREWTRGKASRTCLAAWRGPARPDRVGWLQLQTCLPGQSPHTRLCLAGDRGTPHTDNHHGHVAIYPNSLSEVCREATIRRCRPAPAGKQSNFQNIII